MRCFGFLSWLVLRLIRSSSFIPDSQRAEGCYKMQKKSFPIPECINMLDSVCVSNAIKPRTVNSPISVPVNRNKGIDSRNGIINIEEVF